MAPKAKDMVFDHGAVAKASPSLAARAMARKGIDTMWKETTTTVAMQDELL
jgi:hypothetical protein